ncbi:cellulose binding domain-containing protein [Micromonospora citrea]|uniref:pectate lyase family protein n=1 Tax=Micromonospora citrea TaxID=47855 RepID=UPI003C32F319
MSLAAAVVLVAAGALVAVSGPGVVGASPAAAASACDDRLVGWATVPGSGMSTTTGGGNATPQSITSLGDLRKYAADSTPRVLRISGTISTGTSPVEVGSNKTLIGADASATIAGGINISDGHSNIIVRNLNIRGAGYGNHPADTIAARGSHHLWFDHLNVWDAGDGLMDLTKGSDFITVSWVKFWYTNSSHPHRFASLVSGGADHDATDVGKQNATFHHNWFASLVDQRMPRMLYGKGHVYNSYYTATDNTYAVGVGSLASVLVENNYFKNTRNPHQFMYDRPSYITARGNVYDNTSGKRDGGAGGTGGGVAPFTSPPYSYTPDSAGDVPGIVSSCAGPTLSGSPSPTPTSTPSPTPTSTPSPTPTFTPSPTPTSNPPTNGACGASYRTVGSWSGGWQGEVTVKADNSAINGWTVKWNLNSGQSISQVWSGALTTSGATVTVKNVDYNGSIPAGGSTTFGFIGTGTPSSPSPTCTSP